MKEIKSLKLCSFDFCELLDDPSSVESSLMLLKLDDTIKKTFLNLFIICQIISSPCLFVYISFVLNFVTKYFCSINGREIGQLWALFFNFYRLKY